MSEETRSQPSAEITQTPVPLTRVWFEEFDLPAEVLSGLRDGGYTYCTPLQAQVIPLSLAGRDVAVQAGLETGHTVALLVPLLTHLLRLPMRESGITSAVVAAPTPELARRIYDEARALAAHTGLTLVLLQGEPEEPHEGEVPEQGADIVIGTPGLITASAKKGGFRIGGVKVLAIEDAERFFDLRLVRDLRYLLRKLPHHEKRISMLFSASLSFHILSLIYHYMNLPEFVSGTLEEAQLQDVEQALLHAASQEKIHLLPGLLKREEWNRALVFVNSVETTEKVSRSLKGSGLAAEGITEDMPQRKRLRLMARIQKGQVKILVATDTASRAVHMEGISHVINYDLPQGPRFYVDRLGRINAKAGPRRVISLACEEFVFHLEPIEDMLGYKLPVIWPQEDWFEEEPPAAPPAVTEAPQPHPPAARAEEVQEEKRAVRTRGGAKIVFSDQPGGVFGLAPVKTSSAPDRGTVPRKRPRKRRPRRPPKAE